MYVNHVAKQTDGWSEQNGQTYLTLDNPKVVKMQFNDMKVKKRQKLIESKGVQQCPMVNGMNDSRKLRS